MPYFKSAFDFADDSAQDLPDCQVDRTGPYPVYHVCIDGYALDGIDAETVQRTILFAYTGSIIGDWRQWGDIQETHETQEKLAVLSAFHSSGLESARSPGVGAIDAESELDMHAVMCLLVAGNRFGFSALSQFCEKTLCSHVSDYPENAANCLDFARLYCIPRLEIQAIT